jgi:hypothetical protein
MNLAELVAKPTDRVVLKTGYADTWPNVKLNGSSIAMTWLDGVYAKVGEQVAVAIIVFGDAPPTYVVIGSYTGTQKREGTVTNVSAPVCTLEAPTGSGNFVTATYLGGAPSVGNVMRLLWQGSDVTALGVVGGTPAAPPPAPAPPPPAPTPTTGTLHAYAQDSATYSASYGWNSYYGSDLYQGDGSQWGASSSNNGAAFYGGYTRNLSGLVISAVRLRIPQRNNAGQSGSQIQLNVYVHTNDFRPGGDTSRVLGPYVFTLAPAMGAHWVNLPTAAGDQLKNGGGLAISGGSYAGLFGIGRDSASFQLDIDWSTS